MFLKNIIMLIICTSCTVDNMNKPNPKKIPFELTQHNDIRIDNYYWMRDDSRSNSEVIDYLKTENSYTDNWFSKQTDYKTPIVSELMNQVPETEISFPVKNNGYLYYQIIKKEEQLPKYYKKGIDDGDEIMFLDANLKLQAQKYYSIRTISPSNDNSMIAFAEDNNGRREFTIKILDANTLKELNTLIENTTGTMIWSHDDKYIIYLKKDPITLIANMVYIHELGVPSSDDILLYQENDPEFELSISLSRTKKFAFINIESTNSNEIRVIDINKPMLDPHPFIERSTNHLYYLEHLYNESFFVRSNLDAPNFKILKSSSFEDNEIPNLQTIVSHDESIFISDILYSNNNLVMEVRKNGLPELSILNLKTNKLNYIDFGDNAYDVSLSFNNEIDGKSFNYYYSSLTKAPRIITYNLINNREDIVWSKQVLSFDENDYLDNRFFINSRDGTQIPVVTIAHKSTNLTAAPILFYGYGSYGINIDASFRSSLIPLLDRGFIFSIINIRGGGEMGKHWYENGRMHNKLNTFYDFNDAVKAVLKKGIGNPDNVFARGGSAGGLLMGAIINFEPELYKGILSGVPFVDVLTTMSDPSIPLTTFEYDEWGNPANKDEYFYMKQYSPYDNIKYNNYPAVFITSSLYDSQVQYFEPAKYTAKLREFNTSNSPILMNMNLIGGHGGLSGKINQFEEVAEEYNFILNLVD
jgi:oligopeptidase B